MKKTSKITPNPANDIPRLLDEGVAALLSVPCLCSKPKGKGFICTRCLGLAALIRAKKVAKQSTPLQVRQEIDLVLARVRDCEAMTRLQFGVSSGVIARAEKLRQAALAASRDAEKLGELRKALKSCSTPFTSEAKLKELARRIKKLGKGRAR